MEEITATMKETLARIKHPKSTRPVFTAEFLARVKRVIVFRSLDEQAMLGISQRLVARMQADWLIKRQKTLTVASELVEAIGRRAYALDQKSGGKEGGRIVRKLLADVVEARIQAAIAERPNDYRASDAVNVDYVSAGDLAAPPEQVGPSAGMVQIHFDGNGEAAPPTAATWTIM